MKRILINATQPEELRVAVVDGQTLFDLDIEVPSKTRIKANIYRGRITRIEPSLEAAFVDFGNERHGFLPLKEVARSDYIRDPGDEKAQIKDVLRQGQDLTVQVEKEERGNKGAALTTTASLAGRYLVLMPNSPKAGGVSRRINGQDRSELKEAMSGLRIPDGMGVIARTAGVGRPTEELQWDLDYLVTLWGTIQKAADTGKAPFLIYRESNVVIRALRDYLRSDIGEVIIDDQETHEQARAFMEEVMPQSLNKLKRYEDSTPLFSRYQVESQIESAFRRSVSLPSGGSVVIDHTEALTSIDVNSARATGGADIEDTALSTNLEAVHEITRQLRLRDLGGLIVIDFIDMGPNRNQREVENKIREAAKLDRARVQIGRISRFGLLELSRQRLRPALGEYSHITCPRCNGEGSIRDVESLGLSVLRLMEEESMKGKTGAIVVRLPAAVASFLLNEKRTAIIGLESAFHVTITLLPSPDMETPDYELKRIREDEFSDSEANRDSFALVQEEQTEAPDLSQYHNKRKPAQEPAVRNLPSRAPAPDRGNRESADEDNKGFWATLRAWFAGPPQETESRQGNEQQTQPSQTSRSASPRSRSNSSGRNQSSSRNRGGRGNQQSRASSSDEKGKSSQTSGNRKNPNTSAKHTSSQSGNSERPQGGNRSGSGRRSRGRRGGRNRSRSRQTGSAAQSDKSTGKTANGKTQSGQKSGSPNRPTGNGGQGKSSGSRQHNSQAKGSEDKTARPGSGKSPKDEQKKAPARSEADVES